MADLFNTGTSNNAPPPIPGGFGNSTGFNIGSAAKNPQAGGFPAFPAVGPTSPHPATSGLNASPYGPANFAGLNTGMKPGDPNLSGNFLREFQRAYGKGTGDVLYQMMTQGLFNPQVASNYLNALQPGIQRGQADILNAFGRSGNRFSSSAALGLGDYNSQVQLNEGQLLSGLYENAQTNQLNMLGNTLGTLHNEQANQGSWVDDLLGGLEIAAGWGLAGFTGGASLGLVGAGINSITGKGKGGNQPQSAWQNIKFTDPSQSSSGDSGVPAFPQAMADQFMTNSMTESAGSLFGGANNPNASMPFGLVQ